MDIGGAYVGLEVVEGVADIILPPVQMQNVAGFSYTVPTGSCRNPNPKRHTYSQLSCKVSAFSQLPFTLFYIIILHVYVPHPA